MGTKKGAPSVIVNSLQKPGRRRLLKTNLQKISVLFNKNVKITDNDGEINVDSGLILIKGFFHQTNFKKLVDRFILFRKKRSNV